MNSTVYNVRREVIEELSQIDLPVLPHSPVLAWNLDWWKLLGIRESGERCAGEWYYYLDYFNLIINYYLPQVPR